jgi:DNA-directed RNA polymerase specialized sigma24 family protein
MTGAESSTVNVTPQARVFPTTDWGVVLATGKDNDSTKASAALNELCRTYWYPLYAYVRRRGYSKHDAQDLTQGFFYLFLKRNAFERIEKGLGTFRSYLLTSLNHFLINEQERQQAQKRDGGQPAISLDADEAERRYRLEPADPATPEKLC